MPPHCDSMDGPVVTAAKAALQKKDPKLILPYVKKEGEAEVLVAFQKAMGAHDGSPAANEVADLYFYETAVRVHRAGEGAPYTGLKPAGLGFGPVVPVAEKALETGQVDELVLRLTDTVTEEVHQRFHHAMELKPHADESVDRAREYVEAMLGLEVWSHKLYMCARSGPHEGGHEHEGAHEHAG